MTDSPCTASHKIACTEVAIKQVPLVSYWLVLAAEGTNYFFGTRSKELLNVRHHLQVCVAQTSKLQ